MGRACQPGNKAINNNRLHRGAMCCICIVVQISPFCPTQLWVGRAIMQTQEKITALFNALKLPHIFSSLSFQCLFFSKFCQQNVSRLTADTTAGMCSALHALHGWPHPPPLSHQQLQKLHTILWCYLSLIPRPPPFRPTLFHFSALSQIKKMGEALEWD